MAYEQWPFGKVRTDYSGETNPSIKRTEKESGRVRQEQLDENGWQFHNASWEMTDEQKNYLEAWHKYKINNGADWFEMTMPLATGGVYTAVVRIVNGKLNFQYQESGLFWAVSCQLETDDSHIVTESALDTYLAGL